MWWVVDLLETKRIAMVIIYNRGECCGMDEINYSVFTMFSNLP